MTLLPGTRLGRYEALALLGSGGMGEVYRAHDTLLDRPVALKLLAAAAREDPRFRERFAREARAVVALNHPNILTVFDVGELDGVPYIASERRVPAVAGGGAEVEQRPGGPLGVAGAAEGRQRLGAHPLGLGEMAAQPGGEADVVERVRRSQLVSQAAEDLQAAAVTGERPLAVALQEGEAAGAHQGGETAARRGLLKESLVRSSEVGFREGVAWALDLLAGVALLEGSPPRAAELWRRSLELHHQLGDRWRTASTLEGLVRTSAAAGEAARGARLLGAAEALRREIGAPVPVVERPALERARGALHEALGDGLAALVREGAAAPRGQVVALALGRDAGERRARREA